MEKNVAVLCDSDHYLKELKKVGVSSSLSLTHLSSFGLCWIFPLVLNFSNLFMLNFILSFSSLSSFRYYSKEVSEYFMFFVCGRLIKLRFSSYFLKLIFIFFLPTYGFRTFFFKQLLSERTFSLCSETN